MKRHDFEHQGRALSIFLTNPRDHIQRILSKGKFYEAEFLEALQSQLNEGDVVFDIGTNIGNHTLYFAGVCGCHVHSFEPQAELAAAVRRTAEANSLQDRITVNEVALGSAPGKATMADVPSDNTGRGHISASATTSEGTEVEVTTVDDYVEAAGITSVALMKLDVEGFEVPALTGALETIRRFRPRLAIEAKTFMEFQAIYRLIAPLGYVPLQRFNHSPTFIFENFPEDEVALVNAAYQWWDNYELRGRLGSLSNGLLDARRLLKRLLAVREEIPKPDESSQFGFSFSVPPAILERIRRK